MGCMLEVTQGDMCHVRATVLPPRINLPILQEFLHAVCRRGWPMVRCVGTHNRVALTDELRDCGHGFYVQITITGVRFTAAFFTKTRVVKLRLRSPLSGITTVSLGCSRFNFLLTPLSLVSHAHTLFCPPSFPRATSSRVYTQWHMAQSLKPSLWPLVTGIHPIPSAGSVYDDLVLFLHAFTPLITFGFNL